MAQQATDVNIASGTHALESGGNLASLLLQEQTYIVQLLKLILIEMRVNNAIAVATANNEKIEDLNVYRNDPDIIGSAESPIVF